VKSLFKSSINEKKNDKSVLVCNKKRMIIHHSTTNTNKKRVNGKKTKETNNRKIKEKLEVVSFASPCFVPHAMREAMAYRHFPWHGGRGESCHLDEVQEKTKIK